MPRLANWLLLASLLVVVAPTRAVPLSAASYPSKIVRVPDMSGGGPIETKGPLPLTMLETWPENALNASEEGAAPAGLLVGNTAAVAEHVVARFQASQDAVALKGRPILVAAQLVDCFGTCRRPQAGDAGAGDPRGASCSRCRVQLLLKSLRLRR